MENRPTAPRLSFYQFGLISAALAAALFLNVLPGHGGTEEFSPAETETLRARAGQQTVVTGEIARVGVGPTGVVHFLNFKGVTRGGFVAVVKKGNITAFTEKFGPDFPFSLAGKRVTVSGPVTLYENTPQIELLSPDQIAVED